MKNSKILITILLFFIFAHINPVFSEQAKLLDKTTVQEEIIDENSQNLDTANDVVKTTPKTQEIIENSASWPYENNLKDSIAPEPKTELFRVMISFGKVMLGVVISCFVIFILALFVRKYYGVGNIAQDNNMPQENLRASKNEDEALEKFLSKTL